MELRKIFRTFSSQNLHIPERNLKVFGLKSEKSVTFLKSKKVTKRTFLKTFQLTERNLKVFGLNCYRIVTILLPFS
jgi:hypothetical protein